MTAALYLHFAEPEDITARVRTPAAALPVSGVDLALYAVSKLGGVGTATSVGRLAGFNPDAAGRLLTEAWHAGHLTRTRARGSTAYLYATRIR